MIKKMSAIMLVACVVSSHAGRIDIHSWPGSGGYWFTGFGVLVAVVTGVVAVDYWDGYVDTKHNYENPWEGNGYPPSKKDVDDAKLSYDVANGFFIGSLVVTALGIGLLIWDYCNGDPKVPKTKTAYAPYPSDAPLLAVPQFAPPEPPSRALDFGPPKPEGLRLSVSGSFSWAEDVR